jgi:hypothetical protein
MKKKFNLISNLLATFILISCLLGLTAFILHFVDKPKSENFEVDGDSACSPCTPGTYNDGTSLQCQKCTNTPCDPTTGNCSKGSPGEKGECVCPAGSGVPASK